MKPLLLCISLLLSSAVSMVQVSALSVAVVGSGPGGLLLAHKLLQNGVVSSVSMYEKQPRPSESNRAKSYAVGVGLRGRRAIESVDKGLWKAVEAKVYASSKFVARLGPITITLRDGTDEQATMLCYQSDLCQTLTDELEKRWKDSGRLNMHFDCKLKSLNLQDKYIETIGSKDRFDLVVGCDGNNSLVRKAIEDAWPGFETSREMLPNHFKAVRLESMPPKLDPTAVNALVAGKVTAAVEPTANGCCVLFQGSDGTDPIFSSTNITELEEILVKRYPLLNDGDNIETSARQLAATKGSFQAASVQCNAYHYANVAALVGDAAHATIAQGMNAALVDSIQLANCLNSIQDNGDLEKSLNQALLQYSQRQVPEGWALHDLSFPKPPESKTGKIKNVFRSIRDAVFGGKFGIGQPQVQITLQTSADLFADIRRKRQAYYDDDEAFQDQDAWNAKLEELNNSMFVHPNS